MIDLEYDIPSRSYHGSKATEFGYITYEAKFGNGFCEREREDLNGYHMLVRAVDMFDGEYSGDTWKGFVSDRYNFAEVLERCVNTLEHAQIGRADALGL